MKFVVDAMLGKLAKWLRILGFDTIYDPSIDDPELAEISRKEKRVLLTRDTKLLERKIIWKGYFVKSEEWKEQIKEVIEEFNLKNEIKLFSICSVCNGKLKRVEKSQVEGKVPDFVFDTMEEFLMCERCGRIYWKGTHAERIEELVRGLVER